MARLQLSIVSICVAAGCSADPAATRCTTSSDCPAGRSCIDGSCVDPRGMDAGAADATTPRDAGMGEDVVCRAIEAAAEPTRRPADIIMLIDSSSSMGSSRMRITEVINTDFDAILNASGIDYRVIVLTSVSVLTIGGMLASYTPPRLFHADFNIGSGSGVNFTPILNAWDMSTGGPPPAVDVPWSTLLRPEAVKIWLHFTDATSGNGSSTDGYPGTFDQILYREHPDQFGASRADGKLIYHAFTGMAANMPVEAPWEPTDPIVSSRCSASFNPQPGPGFQQIAIATGGLRYPVCQFDGYDNVFRRIADDVITVSRIACTFALPDPPVGETLDLETVAVRYTPGAGAADQILLQSDAAGCGPMGFVIDEAAGTLELCPEACAVVQANTNPDARIDVAFGCDPTLL